MRRGRFSREEHRVCGRVRGSISEWGSWQLWIRHNICKAAGGVAGERVLRGNWVTVEALQVELGKWRLALTQWWGRGPKESLSGEQD